MGSAQTIPMRVLIDSREQDAYRFTGAPLYANTVTERATLQTADYSLYGLTDKIGIERKSLQDAVQSLGRERERFVREMERARGLDCFALVIEADFAALAHHNYRGQLNAHAAIQSLAAFVARWRLPVIFAGNREGGQYAVWSILQQFLRGKAHELKAVEAAVRTPAHACPAGAPDAPAGACARGMDNHIATEPQDLQDAFGGPAGAFPDGLEVRR